MQCNIYLSAPKRRNNNKVKQLQFSVKAGYSKKSKSFQEDTSGIRFSNWVTTLIKFTIETQFVSAQSKCHLRSPFQIKAFVNQSLQYT